MIDVGLARLRPRRRRQPQALKSRTPLRKSRREINIASVVFPTADSVVVIPGRREAASPESIITAGGYGFRAPSRSLSSGRPKAGPGGSGPGMTTDGSHRTVRVTTLATSQSASSGGDRLRQDRGVGVVALAGAQAEQRPQQAFRH